jgi:hypothetical protein
MRALLHFTEGALSLRLADDEAAYDFTFTVLFFLRVLGRLCAGCIASFVRAVLLAVIFDYGRGFSIGRRFRAPLLFLIRRLYSEYHELVLSLSQLPRPFWPDPIA